MNLQSYWLSVVVPCKGGVVLFIAFEIYSLHGCGTEEVAFELHRVTTRFTACLLIDFYKPMELLALRQSWDFLYSVTQNILLQCTCAPTCDVAGRFCL